MSEVGRGAEAADTLELSLQVGQEDTPHCGGEGSGEGESRCRAE